MSWSIGFDSDWKRDIGYGVPAYCDHPGCNAEIDRGLSYVCGGEPYGQPRGCGLYFCEKHLSFHGARIDGEIKTVQLCERCAPKRKKPFPAKPDHPEWIQHKLTDPSWEQWREENREWVEKITPAHAEGGRMIPEIRWGVLITRGPIPGHLPTLLHQGIRGGVWNSDDIHKARAKGMTLPKRWGVQVVQIKIEVV